MYILGISAYYHDSAACLIKNGEIIAAAQEERFSRKKHDASFPHLAIKYCLKEAEINASDIMNVVFYEKPFIKFERLIETYLALAPRGFISFSKAMIVWTKEKLFQKSLIIKGFKKFNLKIDWKINFFFQSIIFLMLLAHFILHLLIELQYLRLMALGNGRQHL